MSGNTSMGVWPSRQNTDSASMVSCRSRSASGRDAAGDRASTAAFPKSETAYPRSMAWILLSSRVCMVLSEIIVNR